MNHKMGALYTLPYSIAAMCCMDRRPFEVSFGPWGVRLVIDPELLGTRSACQADR